ncbi:ribosomal L1 domain-containing protein CG13096 [Hetaerina americana]|uniref:ribosomal L1 domain-containing protein CG13096 n=1 Tax=Hetaerina americana TaxID=62018 RepID=UPI003A7F6193
MVEKSEVDEDTHGKNENALPKGYSPKQVEDGVKVLFQVLKKTPKKSLFADEGEYIRLQISAIRIPKNKKKNYRFTLPNGILKETAEVCLFVKNHSKHTREYEDTVRNFKNILAEAGVTGISEVISVNQLMQEYKTYEMKRRLAARFDLFLADSAISNWLHGALGKHFHRCRKQPTPVNLKSKNLKAEIDKALVKTTLTITGKGAQLMTKIGHTKQSVEEICQNIEALVKGLRFTFPGKWKNVRSLLIRTDDSIAVPLYFSYAHPNSIEVPKQVRQPQSMVIRAEVGEISTLPDGYEVMVLPSGDVKVKGKKSNGAIGWLNDDELRELGDLDPLNDDEDEVENDESDDELHAEENERVSYEKQEEGDNYSDSEEEEACVEAAEEAYLKELKIDMMKKSSKKKPEKSESNKRKVETSDGGITVKKAKSATKVKNDVSTAWKVEVIANSNESGAQNGKSFKKMNNSWKIDAVTQATKTKKNLASTEASVRTKREMLKKKHTNREAQGLISNLGAKGKVSGNKLGKKKSHKLK